MQRTLRAILPVLVASLLLVVTVPTAAGAGTRIERYRGKLMDLVNEKRQARGIPRLHIRAGLNDDAQRHSARMARERRLFHTPDLSSKVRTFRPHIWGENVGYGSTMRQVVNAWMRSAPHRSNLLNRRFDGTGVGVVRAGGRYWLTMIYIG